MKERFNARTKLLNQKFYAIENEDNGEKVVWFVVNNSDTGLNTVIDLNKETAIELANWILKENEK